MLIIILLFVCILLITFCFGNPRKILNKILFRLYFSIFFFAFLFVIITWPYPILNGRTVRNGPQWSKLLKHTTILMRVKWEIRNGEVLAKDRGAVIVANHQSTLDIVGIFQLWEMTRKLTIIAKKALLYTGPLGLMCYFAGIIFIDRFNPKNAYRQLEEARNVINKKVKIWFFPEGTRNFDNTKFLPFKKGAFIIAVTAQAPIIPVVYAPYYFIDRKNYTVNKGRAIIRCLDEVPTTGLTTDDVPELIERVRNIMLATYKELSDEVMPITTQEGKSHQAIIETTRILEYNKNSTNKNS